jgi:hypothetical protein
MEIYRSRSLLFRSNARPNRSKAGKLTTASSFFRKEQVLDSNFVGSMRQNYYGELRIGQRLVAAVSGADYLCGSCRVERSLWDPDYKPSSLRTWYGRQSDPSKVSMTFMRPPQQGHGGGS